MQIDLKNVIKKIPEEDMTLKASVDTIRRNKVKSRNKKAFDYPGLGDVNRFKDFPNEVNEDFISMYRDSLDEFLVPYVQFGEMTVTSANRFIEGLVEQIFGNENHYGIFSYLREKNYDNSPERELVRTAERLINSGWRVVKDGQTNRYKIINSDNSTVIDATGKSNFFEESSAVVMDESSAHVFIGGDNASKIESLARSVDLDADSLAEIDSLDALLFHTEDKMLTGQIMNYKKLRNVLKKMASYKVTKSAVSFNDLHEDGFVLCSELVFSEDDRLLLTDGKNKVIVYPVSPGLNQRFNINKNLLSVLSSEVKQKIFSSIPSVIPQELTEISDLNRVFALLSEYWSDDRVYMSGIDMIDSFRRMDTYVKSGDISKDFYNKVFSSFAMIVATEVILLGNNWFSLSSLSFDPVSGKFYSYANRDSFTVTEEDFNNFYDSYEASKLDPPSFSVFTNEIYPFKFNGDTFKNLAPLIIENLPREFFSVLMEIDFEFDGYPYEFTEIKNHMSKAKDLLISRSN